MNNIKIPKDAVITIAGTVGVGKSTMTKTIADKLGFQTSLEKVDDNPYLEPFYSDFQRWSFHLQVYFLAERFKEQKRIFESGGGYVQDRSIYEDTGIFAKIHAAKGTMSEVDYATYTSLCESLGLRPYFPHPDVLIYLHGNLDHILHRIEERGREMETQTDRAYWEEMYTRYTEWIEQFDLCPVIKINIEDYDLLHDESSLDPILHEIASVIQKNRNQTK